MLSKFTDMNREKTQKLWELLSDDKWASVSMTKEDFIGMKKIVCIGINTSKLWNNRFNHRVQLISNHLWNKWEYKFINFRNKSKAKKFVSFINKENEPFKLKL